MSGDVQLELHLHEYKMDALCAALDKKSTTIKERMQISLDQLYELEVPIKTQQIIRAKLNVERAVIESKAKLGHTVFRVRQGDTDEFLQLDHRKTFLDTAKFLYDYFQKQQTSASAALREVFCDLKSISAGQYDHLAEIRMESPEKVAGVYDLNFDKREISVIETRYGWCSYDMEDILIAARYGFGQEDIALKHIWTRFLGRLDSREITSAGHLSAREIMLTDEICEMTGQRLNFCLEPSFDVDAVFGTHVCTDENDDMLNVYADYDMAAGQVCDELEVDLHRADGQVESLEYRLNAVEKAVLLRKMDAYCQQQTGQTLAEYSAQLLAEDMAPPTQPMM